MAMKTKKERFHVGALNQDLEGEMSRQEEEEEREGGVRLLLNFTSHSVQEAGKQTNMSCTKKLTVLESSSCLFCAKTFSTPAWSAYVTKPNPLHTQKKENTQRESRRGARSLRGKA